jgi:thioredoxin-related protein
MMNVSMVPHVFVFNKEGKQIYTHMGYKPGDEEELFKIIKDLK